MCLLARGDNVKLSCLALHSYCMQINACYNAVDRHIATRGEAVALIHEADDPGNSTTITYSDLLARVCRVANAMLQMGVRKVSQKSCLPMAHRREPIPTPCVASMATTDAPQQQQYSRLNGRLPVSNCASKHRATVLAVQFCQ